MQIRRSKSRALVTKGEYVVAAPPHSTILSTRKAMMVSLALLILSVVPTSVDAKSKYSVESPLTVDQQKALRRGVGYAKKGKKDKAAPIFNAVISEATDLPKCLAIAEYTEQYGFQLVDVRRALMKKALDLCRTRDDYILVALKARQYECFEVTRNAIQQMISNSKSPEELTDLARKAQEVALNDVSHLAMEKAYANCRTVPQALQFAKQVSAMGMDDLLRKVVKELIDDEPKTRQLCILLRQIEHYDMKDLNRYCLKKALTQSMSVQDFADVWEAAGRLRQKDIYELAAYRGKKLKLLQQINSDRASHSQKVQEWQENRAKEQDANQRRVEADLSRRQGLSQSGF